MNKFIKKILAVFLLAVFFLASGTGQLIHATFHDHCYHYTVDFNKGSNTVNTQHTYCIALLLTLPEFFESGICVFESIPIFQDRLFADLVIVIPHLFEFKNSDRAPPVLA